MSLGVKGLMWLLIFGSLSECTLQPSDDFWDTLRTIPCLKDEVCDQLNKEKYWRGILNYIREVTSIPTLEGKDNPAEETLQILRSARPDLTLGGFFEILQKTGRPDLKQIISDHYVNCSFCKRNQFDRAPQGPQAPPSSLKIPRHIEGSFCSTWTDHFMETNVYYSFFDHICTWSLVHAC